LCVKMFCWVCLQEQMPVLDFAPRSELWPSEVIFIP
jgi:hypothetical protein